MPLGIKKALINLAKKGGKAAANEVVPGLFEDKNSRARMAEAVSAGVQDSLVTLFTNVEFWREVNRAIAQAEVPTDPAELKRFLMPDEPAATPEEPGE